MGWPKLPCSICKRKALVAKIRTPAGATVTAIFCLRCDTRRSKR